MKSDPDSQIFEVQTSLHLLSPRSSPFVLSHHRSISKHRELQIYLYLKIHEVPPMAPNWYSGPQRNTVPWTGGSASMTCSSATSNACLPQATQVITLIASGMQFKECAQISVEERIILAIIMQESHGDVGVRTTFSPGDVVLTGGLMQCCICMGNPE